MDWTIKKTNHQRTDTFELWCWRRLLRAPWTSRRSNQSIPKEISPEYSLEELMLKLQSFGHLMGRADSFEKTWCWERLKVGGEGDDRGWDGWMASLTRWIWVWVSSESWWWTGKLGVLQSMGSQKLDTTEQLNSNNRHQTARDSPYAPEVSQSIRQSTGSSQNLANPTPLPYLSCPQSFRLLLH